MTRLSMEVKKELCTNLLHVSPLYAKAKATLQRRADLVERIRQACLVQMKTSDAEITAIVKSVMSIKGVNYFASPKVKYEMTKKDEKFSITVGINGQSRELDTRGIDSFWHGRDGMRYIDIANLSYFGPDVAPAQIPGRYIPTDRILLVNADKFNDELSSSDVEIKNLFGEMEEFRLKVMGALRPINTTKQLVENWPDAVQYLPEIVQPTRREIALSVDTLNAICGIPQEG